PAVVSPITRLECVSPGRSWSSSPIARSMFSWFRSSRRSIASIIASSLSQTCSGVSTGPRGKGESGSEVAAVSAGGEPTRSGAGPAPAAATGNPMQLANSRHAVNVSADAHIPILRFPSDPNRSNCRSSPPALWKRSTECPCRSCCVLVELRYDERHQNRIDAGAGVVEMFLIEVITHIHDHRAAGVLPVEVAPVREDPALLVKPSLTQCRSQLLRPPGAGWGIATRVHIQATRAEPG